MSKTNGFGERFHRTLTERIIHGRTYQDLAQLRAAVGAFVPSNNHHCRVGKLQFQSPFQARLAFNSPLP